MEIRRAVLGDLEQLKKLLYQVAHVHHLGRPDIFKAASKKYTDEELSALLMDDSRPIFVAVEDGKVVGHLYCIFKQAVDSHCLTDIKSLYIDDLCIDEERRGQHIGERMYAFIRKYAKEQGCYNITLNVWSCNPGAMRFYEKMGLAPQKVGMEEIL